MKSDLEKQILKLKPGALPSDLVDRLKDEPPLTHIEENMTTDVVAKVIPIKNNRWVWGLAVGVAAAACFIILMARESWKSSDQSNGPELVSVDLDSSKELSMIRRDETLIRTTTLATEELDGQLWEIVEEKWIDDTFAACSAVPVLVSAQEFRREIIFRPVVFQ
jgi:hypothetical protein